MALVAVLWTEIPVPGSEYGREKEDPGRKRKELNCSGKLEILICYDEQEKCRNSQ